MTEIFEDILKIANSEFGDIIQTIFFVNYKIRIVLIDKSFVDVGISKRITGRFSFHWECNDEKIFRYDNFPDGEWSNVDTFPYHFHNGSQNNVDASPFPTDEINGFREFMEFIKKRLQNHCE